jgi:hypothetical protein
MTLDARQSAIAEAELIVVHDGEARTAACACADRRL